MTFVDDSLLGAAPIRSAKSGSKSADKQYEAAAANQRSAFENAFADAGKKKQPVISISAKQATETGTKALTTAVTTTDTVSSSDTAALDPDSALSLPGFADNGEMQPALGYTANAAFRSAAKQMLMPQTGEEPTVEPEAHGQTFTLAPSESKANPRASIGLADLGADATADAGQILDEQAGDKIKVLLKDTNAQLSKRTATSEEALPSNAQGDADAAIDTAPADVSHLLALLGAAQKPTDADATVPAETTPVLSEFQALAESAGKAKVGSRDAAAAKASAHSEVDASAATQPGSDKVFRFARADGKGQAVSMNLASDSDKGVVTNDTGSASTTAAKAETVTVVEARRYLGFAPSSNASAVTSQIVSNPEWASALQSSAAPSTEVSTGKVLNTLKIQMHPIDLGTVTATLRLKDDELHVELKVETGDAFRQLSDDQGAMVKALRAQGFAVDQVSIVFNAPDSSSGNNTQQQAQPQTGQQGREAAGDGPAQGRGERNDSGSEQQDSGRWTRNEGTSDASSGAELNRTGDVYM